MLREERAMPVSERVCCSRPALTAVDDPRLTMGRFVTADADCGGRYLAFPKRVACRTRKRFGSAKEALRDTRRLPLISIRSVEEERP